jgi:hypothetical protein
VLHPCNTSCCCDPWTVERHDEKHMHLVLACATELQRQAAQPQPYLRESRHTVYLLITIRHPKTLVTHTAVHYVNTATDWQHHS